VRIVPCLIVMAALCPGLTGCSMFNKRPAANERGAASSTDMPFKPPEPAPVTGRAPTEADLGGMLAGRVIDSYNNRPTDAYIRWVCLEDKQETPVDVAANPEGYFTIQGLKKGKHYKLMARAKNGEHVLAGVTYTEAPNVRVLIKLSEDFASAATPPVPGVPNYPGPRAQTPAQKTQAPGATLMPPGWQGGADRLPTPSIGAPKPAAPEPPPIADPTNIAAGGVARNDPLVEVPRTTVPAWQPGGDPPSAPPAPMADPQAPAAPAPSCVLVGKQLINFALRDISGEVWEWKRNRKGKLVLLDFWSTTCVPCLHTVPHLHALQEKHGWAGFEVVSVANEKGSSHEERAHRVAGMAARMSTNYRLLLDGGNACPVRRDFAVQYLPTLVLLDENGWILWRHEGELSRSELTDLELLIKRRLGER
jgi:thiol-disulfide isomerase/thioredoxin